MAQSRAVALVLLGLALVLTRPDVQAAGAPVAAPRPSPPPTKRAAAAPATTGAPGAKPIAAGAAPGVPPSATVPRPSPPPPAASSRPSPPPPAASLRPSLPPPAASTRPSSLPAASSRPSPPLAASLRPTPPPPARRPPSPAVPSPAPVTESKVAAENLVLLGGTYTLFMASSVSSCTRARGYLSSPGCATRTEAPVTAQPVLQSGTSRRLQFWRLEPTGSATWANVQGFPIRIQNDGRATAQAPCDSLLRVLPACSGSGVAKLGALSTPTWVLEGGPTSGRFYIRDSRCGSPLYLGFHKTNCSRTSPMLFAKTNTQADLLWQLELVSAGISSVSSVTVSASGNTFNIVRVLVRRSAGPGVTYRVLGAPVTLGAATMDVTGAGEPVTGNQLRFTFTNIATRGATYNFTVQPRNSVGLGPLSAGFTFKMPQPPGPPRDLKVWSTVTEENVPIILADFLQPASNGGAVVDGYNVIGTAKGKDNLVIAGQPVRFPDGRWQVRIETFAPLNIYNFTAFARNCMGWSGPSNVVQFLAPNDGTCQGEAEQCVAGSSCCSTTPALYCQKDTANQLLGTCELCVNPNYFGCSAVNACCDTRKCEMANSTDSNGQCRTCVGLSKYGCTELADCCAGNACQRDALVAPGGTCVMCVALNKFGCLNSARCCNGKLCQRALPTSPFGSCQDCIGLTSHGCSTNANCCNGGLCQRANLTDALGTCQRCITQTTFGCANNSQCCADLKCEKVNATVAIGSCRTCINPNLRGCASTADCCNTLPCQKDTASAALGTCLQCISVTKFGCAKNGDCCSSKLCQKDTNSSALGSCQNCITVPKFGCFKKADCCSGSSCLKDQPSASVAGTCSSCIPDNKYGCESNSECCTPGYLCVAGQCRCAKEKEQCSEMRNCCGGGTSLFCQLNDALDLTGTCEKCVGDGKYGCSTARNSSCCSFPFRQCGEGISGFQCKKGAGTCSRAGEACVGEADCCVNTPLLMCERNSVDDVEGECTTCIHDGEYGCSKDTHCCTTDYLCNAGVCQCSLQGGKCLSDASCCGADDAFYCQRVNPTDKYGTCEVCISDDRFGCADTMDNCCSDYMCFAFGGGKACKCATADRPCISHASCCKGANPLYCEKDKKGDAQGACKNCLDIFKYGCEGHNYCCWGNKCQRPDPISQGTCELCLALLSFGCDVTGDCCEPNVCQRNVSTEIMGSCQTCIAFTKHGCAYANQCCGKRTCQKEALDSAVGTCETCIPLNKYGCEAGADCCDSKKCEFEAESSRIGQCKECIKDASYGCATNADCCGSSKCQRSKPTDALGYCQPCIANDKFGCSQAEDDCCTDYMCRANQTSLACNCAPANNPCISGGSCCNNLVCLRATAPPDPVPFGNFGSCSTCIPDYKHGCVTKDSCCSTDKLCQKTKEDSKGGTCEECIQTDTFGCYDYISCCGATDKCERRSPTDITGSCRACVSESMYGCDTSEDCCLLSGQINPLVCQRNRPSDPLGTCVACVADNKYGCQDSSFSYTCCSDFLCQTTASFDNACLCSAFDTACRSKDSCCNKKNVCQRDTQYDEFGACKNCIEEGSSGCLSVNDCCNKSNFCQKENKEPSTLGGCSTCIGDDLYGCTTTEDCCNPFLTCNDGRCGCAKVGETCASEYSCCQDGAVPLYCQKDTYLSPLGTCQPCVANAKYGCNDQATDSCCDTSGNFACSLGLGGGLYLCRKTIQAPCSIERLPCTTEADCCPGNPDAAEPFLLCSRKTPLGVGTCEQCVPTNYNGCDTLDEVSCCKGLDVPADVCTANGKGGAVCLPS